MPLPTITYLRGSWYERSTIQLCIFYKAENWVQVEYDPNIIDAEVDEAIELLVNVTFLQFVD